MHIGPGDRATGGTGTSQPVTMTIGELAARDGVHLSVMSRRVARLVEKHGLEVERDIRGRVARVALAQYDRLLNRTRDLAQAQDAAEVREPAAGGPFAAAYAFALAREKQAKADIAEIELRRRRGELVPVEVFRAVVEDIAAGLVTQLEEVVRSVDQVEAAAAAGGAEAVERLIGAQLANAAAWAQRQFDSLPDLIRARTEAAA